jgi:hypothetical protein
MIKYSYLITCAITLVESTATAPGVSAGLGAFASFHCCANVGYSANHALKSPGVSTTIFICIL